MKQIRLCVFETNSSNTHSMTIISDADYEKLKVNTDCFFKNDRLFTRAEAIAKLNEERTEWGGDPLIDGDEDSDYDVDEELRYHDFISYDHLFASDYLEVDHNEHTTPNGEKFHIICEYGRDG